MQHEKDYLLEIDQIQYIAVPVTDIPEHMAENFMVDIHNDSKLIIDDIEEFAEFVNVSVENLKAFYGSYFDKIIKTGVIPFHSEFDGEEELYIFFPPSVLKDHGFRVVIPVQLRTVAESLKIKGIYYFDSDMGEIEHIIIPAGKKDVVRPHVKNGKMTKKVVTLEYDELKIPQRKCGIYVQFTDRLYPVYMEGFSNIDIKTGREIIDIKIEKHTFNVRIETVKFNKSKFRLTATY